MDDLHVDQKKYAGDFPYFRLPAKIGEFSLDEKRVYQADTSQKKFMCWPTGKSLQHGQSVSVDFDLNHLMERVIRKDDSHHDERLANLLQWISRNKDKFVVNNGDQKKQSISSLSTGFVCYRGLMTRLMCTPYEAREPWIICATRWRGTVYLCAFDTDQKIAERHSETARQKRMASWGFKFEQYLMADAPDGRPQVEAPVAETAEFCCVMRGRLGRHSIVYGAEVDGVDPLYNGNGESAMRRYVELKTSREVENQRQQTTLQRFKMLKWWCQSFLVGIERVLVGFRDDDGIVHRLHCYGTRQLPHHQTFWAPAVCMNFTAAFLDYVVGHVTADDPHEVCRLDYDPRHAAVTCRRLTGAARQRYRVLPDWYIETMFAPGDDAAA